MKTYFLDKSRSSSVVQYTYCWIIYSSLFISNLNLPWTHDRIFIFAICCALFTFRILHFFVFHIQLTIIPWVTQNEFFCSRTNARENEFLALHLWFHLNSFILCYTPLCLVRCFWSSLAFRVKLNITISSWHRRRSILFLRDILSTQLSNWLNIISEIVQVCCTGCTFTWACSSFAFL